MSARCIRRYLTLCEALLLTEVEDCVYDNMQGVPVSIYRNPTPNELAGRLKRSMDGSLRGLVIGDDVYVWDGYYATHWEIAEFIGHSLADSYGLAIEGNHVFYLDNPMLHPDITADAIVAAITELPSFKRMQVSHRPWHN